MSKTKFLLALIAASFLTACSLGPVQTSQVNTYSLHSSNTFGQTTNQRNSGILLVTATNASSSFASTNMYYQQQPYQLQSFAKNAWLNTPSDMIANNIVENLNQLRLFKAVFNNVNPGANVSYILNSRLISLYQDFTHKPSVLVMSVQLTLINAKHNQVLASQIFTYNVPCTEDTPYGGVLAANKALGEFLNDMDRFVLTAIQ